MKGFQGVPIQVACSKLGSFMVLCLIRAIFEKCLINVIHLTIILIRINIKEKNDDGFKLKTNSIPTLGLHKCPDVGKTGVATPDPRLDAVAGDGDALGQRTNFFI